MAQPPSDLRLLPPPADDGFSCSTVTEPDGRQITVITVPRVAPVMEALRAYRADLRLKGISRQTLSFEVLEAA